MEEVIIFIILGCIAAILVGLINPNLVLKLDDGQKVKRTTILKIYGTILIICLFIGFKINEEPKETSTPQGILKQELRQISDLMNKNEYKDAAQRMNVLLNRKGVEGLEPYQEELQNLAESLKILDASYDYVVSASEHVVSGTKEDIIMQKVYIVSALNNRPSDYIMYEANGNRPTDQLVGIVKPIKPFSEEGVYTLYLEYVQPTELIDHKGFVKETSYYEEITQEKYDQINFFNSAFPYYEENRSNIATSKKEAKSLLDTLLDKLKKY